MYNVILVSSTQHNHSTFKYTTKWSLHCSVIICPHANLLQLSLTIFLKLYNTALWPTYFINESLYLLTSLIYFSPSPPTSPLAPICLYLWLCFCSVIFHLFYFLGSTYKWTHIVFVFLWLISLIIIPSRSKHVVAIGKNFILFYGRAIFSFILYVFIF